MLLAMLTLAVAATSESSPLLRHRRSPKMLPRPVPLVMAVPVHAAPVPGMPLGPIQPFGGVGAFPAPPRAMPGLGGSMMPAAKAGAGAGSGGSLSFAFIG